MPIDIKAPAFPESITDGLLAAWHKEAGEAVRRDEPLADVETDKITMEVVAPSDGRLAKILIPVGATVTAEQLIAHFEAGAFDAPASDGQSATGAPSSGAEATGSATTDSEARAINPAARALMSELGLAPDQVPSQDATRITKSDVLAASSPPAPASTPDESRAQSARAKTREREETRAPMSRMRARIAERMLETVSETAMLTTFNEVDMQALLELREQIKPAFQARYGVKAGLMSFFVRALCGALQRFPTVNASLDGNEIVQRNYCDISVAVATERGLLTPVLRDADTMGLAEIERRLAALADKARSGKIELAEITGGTFTLTNGGVFGSMLSTPLLNPPQTAILGMHTIQRRPVARTGADGVERVLVSSMMYLALSYDHRLIDGREAVQCLLDVKQSLEKPAILMLDAT